MRPTLAFILDQVLLFWPPCRQEEDSELDGQADRSAARESLQFRRDCVPAREGHDSRQGLAH